MRDYSAHALEHVARRARITMLVKVHKSSNATHLRLFDFYRLSTHERR